MNKKEVLAIVKEVLGLSSAKEAEAFIKQLDLVVDAVGEKLVVDKEKKKSPKANLGKISLQKVIQAGRDGEITLKDGSVKKYTTEDKEVVKAKLK